MPDSVPRLTVVTPSGEFPIDDPRASQAIADYVKSEALRGLQRAHVDKLNKTLAVLPQEGVCLACQRRLPLFIFRCDHWAEYGFSHSHDQWLCTRCASRGEELADDGKCISDEMTWEPYEGWNPFSAPTPGTLAWKLQRGPTGKIRSYEPPGGTT